MSCFTCVFAVCVCNNDAEAVCLFATADLHPPSKQTHTHQLCLCLNINIYIYIYIYITQCSYYSRYICSDFS